MNKLSVAIAAYNEEKNIRECIESVYFADEVVVVDGMSLDDTAKVAKRFGAKVYSVPNQPLMKKNMNLAFEKCTGNWILSLDADERVSPQLAKEIRERIENSDGFVAFQIPRKNLFFGKYLEHTGWYPDYQDRLFMKGKAKFPAKNVHEELSVDGNIGQLVNPLDHIHYTSISQWLSKLDNYTTYEAKKIIDSGKKITWRDAITFPLEEFLSRFFARKGYLDGLHGLVLSLFMAFYWEIIFAKIWEHEKFWQYNSDKFLDEVVAETKKVSKDFHHWVAAESKDPIKKITHKVKKYL